MPKSNNAAATAAPARSTTPAPAQTDAPTNNAWLREFQERTRLTNPQVAQVLNVSEASVLSWKKSPDSPSARPMPDTARAFLELWEATRELVDLKFTVKDADPADYEKRKPSAWENARRALRLP